MQGHRAEEDRYNVHPSPYTADPITSEQIVVAKSVVAPAGEMSASRKQLRARLLPLSSRSRLSQDSRAARMDSIRGRSRCNQDDIFFSTPNDAPL